MGKLFGLFVTWPARTSVNIPETEAVNFVSAGRDCDWMFVFGACKHGVEAHKATASQRLYCLILRVFDSSSSGPIW